jgi:hypothetical protein
MKPLLLTSIVLLPVGSLLVLLGFLIYRRIARFRRRAVSTDGVITDFKTGQDSDGDTVYYPIFRFRTDSGQEYTICSETGSNPPGFKKGASVGVLYDPDKPTDARLDTFMQLWLGPLILFALGGVSTLVGVVLLLIELLGG